MAVLPTRRGPAIASTGKFPAACLSNDFNKREREFKNARTPAVESKKAVLIDSL